MDIVDHLLEIPEFHLRLIPLAWELVNDDGSLDDQKVLYHQAELQQAIDEMEAYVREAAKAVECLKLLL